MNKMNRKILSLSLAFVLVGSVGAYAFAFQGDGNEDAVTPKAYAEVKADSKPLDKNPEPILKGNADKLAVHSQSFKATKSGVLDDKYLEEHNAEVKLTEYMTYEQFVKLTGDDAVSTEIAKDRVVLAVQVYYPIGLEHPRFGLIKNCLATGMYDAETGEYLGGSFQTMK
jgi:hypothetical protein